MQVEIFKVFEKSGNGSKIWGNKPKIWGTDQQDVIILKFLIKWKPIKNIGNPLKNIGKSLENIWIIIQIF